MASINPYKNGVSEEERITGNETFERKKEECTKNNHDSYIDVNDLSLSCLPANYQDGQILYFITLQADLTGRIEFPCTNEDNKEMKIRGTGFVQKIRPGKLSKCPCPECKGEFNDYFILTVTTVNHVVGENGNFRDATMLLETTTSSFTIYGNKISKTDRDEDSNEDWCAVEFISHEIDKVKELERTLENLKRTQGNLYEKFSGDENLVVITGYPHGLKKQVSIGKLVKKKEILKEVRVGQEWCRYKYDATTCPGSSGSPVFILGQPICGYGYWFGHSHNHSKGATIKNEKNCQINTSSVGVNKK
ncbi:unnamed protein product [Lymnaea stagnalis]|uniref:Uncharacterized protein n=1 Tax=Lymnaea stagnalis TaxID=6523 RepID=A0AAV2HPE2_LYMST